MCVLVGLLQSYIVKSNATSYEGPQIAVNLIAVNLINANRNNKRTHTLKQYLT